MSPHNTQTNDYKVGWVCALPIELAAAQVMLDEEYENVAPNDPSDTNAYTLGCISGHNIVIACLPAGQTGNSHAALVAARMKSSFPSLQFCLMVGIGGGVPSKNVDIRLGDVVIGQPDKQYGGVVQFDIGKSTPTGFQRTGSLDSPPAVLLSAISKMRANGYRGKSNLLSNLAAFGPILEFSRPRPNTFDQITGSPQPSSGTDVLFQPTYNHVGGLDCNNCDLTQSIKRNQRQNNTISVHYGTIASGNQVMRCGITRDTVSAGLGGVLCFEMEAAGLIINFPCLVIRGICDYADSHKNKAWQGFASATSAASAKELLSFVPIGMVVPNKIANKTDIFGHQVAPNKAITKTPQLLGNKEIIQSTIEAMKLKDITSRLSIIEQQSEAPQGIEDDPNLYWVFRNIDFKEWRSDTSSVLCLSAPHGRMPASISQSIITQERQGITANRSMVLSFLASEKILRGSPTIYFIHTLIEQLIHSSFDEPMAIAQRFLNRLLEGRTETDQYWSELILKHQEKKKDIIKEILNTTNTCLWEALQSTIASLGFQKLSFVIHGLEYFQHDSSGFYNSLRSVIEWMREQLLQVRILLTSQPFDKIQEVFRGYPSIEYDKERNECIHSLRFSNTRFKNISQEHEGSCDWLWKHKQYKKWLSTTTSSFLLIEGKPASGKSTLMKYHHQNFKSHVFQDNLAIIAKFFYSYRDGPIQRNHSSMLRSILYDILEQDETFFYHCYQLEYRNVFHRQPHLDWPYEALKRVLKLLSSNPAARRLHLIIDAVDESETTDRREILEMLFGLCTETHTSIVKVLVASRPVEVIESRRHRFQNYICLQDETREAISKFAASFIHGLRATRILDLATAYITDNAQGVFLWVKLVCEELIECEERGASEDEMFEFLKKLPTDLGMLYEHMLKRMIGTGRAAHDATKMFQFVLYARRPLFLDELLHAIAIWNHLSTEKLLSDTSFEKRIPSQSRILFCGGNFLEIKEIHGRKTVQVMHQTVREFFLDPQGQARSSLFIIEENSSHRCICNACLSYLRLCAKSSVLLHLPFKVNEWTQNHFELYLRYLNQRPLLSYAISQLKHHLNKSQPEDNCGTLLKSQYGSWQAHTSMFLLLQRLMRSEDTHPFLSNRKKPLGERFMNKSLLKAAQDGLLTAAEILVGAGADCNAISEQETPLSSSAKHGRDLILRMLLSLSEIKINLQTPDGRSALSHAAEVGRESVVRLLLTFNEILPKSKCELGRTPLSYASENGHTEIVRLLIGHKMVEADSRGQYHRTPLSYAAQNGHTAVVKMLLDHTGVDPDLRCPFQRSPLSYAAENGHKEIVQMLLDIYEVDTVPSSITARTAMTLAIQHGYEDLYELLKEKDISHPDSRCRFLSTPLSYATRGGHQNVVDLLNNARKFDTTDFQMVHINLNDKDSGANCIMDQIRAGLGSNEFYWADGPKGSEIRLEEVPILRLEF